MVRQMFRKTWGLLVTAALAWGATSQSASAQCSTGACGSGNGYCGTGYCGTGNIASSCGAFCQTHGCPPKSVFCQERPPHMKFVRGCARPICDPCTQPNFGYYQTCWTQWPYPPNWSHCPVPPPAAQVGSGVSSVPVGVAPTTAAPPVYVMPQPVEIRSQPAVQGTIINSPNISSYPQPSYGQPSYAQPTYTQPNSQGGGTFYSDDLQMPRRLHNGGGLQN